jgi:hypothetical protein
LYGGKRLLILKEAVVNRHLLSPNPGNQDTGTTLVQQLDSSIGEASSVMGALVTELIRRSLRDGVLQIGQGLEGFASEQVGKAITSWQPALERAAIKSAQEAAQHTASAVARGELDVLQQAAQQQAAQLSSQIEEASRVAGDNRNDLSRQLQEKIAEAERRAQERACVDMDERLRELKARARLSSDALKDRLGRLEDTAKGLRQFLKILEERINWLCQEMEESRVSQDELAAHLIELEESRGWRGFLRSLCFWRSRQTEEEIEEEDEDEDDDQAQAA